MTRLILGISGVCLLLMSVVGGRHHALNADEVETGARCTSGPTHRSNNVPPTFLSA